MRRFGEPRQKGQTYQRRSGAYAIVAEGRDLLLTLQQGLSIELQLPGGGIDPGETPVQALHREVYEETGYRIRNPRRLGAYQRFTYMPEYDMWAHKICHIFLCAPARCIGPPPDQEHTPVWMPADLASDALTNTGDQHFVDQVIRYL